MIPLATEPRPRPRLCLPDESPLVMPRQPLVGRTAKERSRGFRWSSAVARLVLVLGTVAISVVGVYEMWGVISAGRATWPQLAFLAFFVPNFVWISYSAVQASLGFIRLVLRGWFARRSELTEPEGRTAVLVPVYNEDPWPVRAAIEVMREGLLGLAPGAFHFFILSDTNRADAWVAEEACFEALSQHIDSPCPVYYRRRSHNSERKAGNIADWVGRWGGDYDSMLILDADSLMAPETIVRLAHRIEREPGLGLIQTLPGIINARSLYGRVQQFANRCYGAIFGAGLASWHGRSSSFWGHNAIIRVRAFAESAKLPLLSGTPPWGGSVLSHDFIEAAMLRRHGWGVRIDDDLEGSYEGAPPSLMDVFVRDRRWCQGNMQHARFVHRRGYRFLSRVHLLTGIYSYLGAVAWFVMIALGLALAVQAVLTRPEYFAEPGLLPTWPVFESERAIRLFVLSMGIVLWPKVLGAFAIFLSWKRLWSFGGPFLVVGSAIVETLLSALYAPMMMLTHCRMVIDVVRGRDSGWTPQRRGDGSISFAGAMRDTVFPAVLGAFLAAVAWLANPWLLAWLLPISVGLVLAGPLAWLSASRGAGALLGYLGILRAPDERWPHPIVRAYRERLAGFPVASARPALQALADDPELLSWHMAQLPRVPDEFCPERVLAFAKAERVTNLATLDRFLSAEEKLRLIESAELPRIIQRTPGPGR